MLEYYRKREYNRSFDVEFAIFDKPRLFEDYNDAFLKVQSYLKIITTSFWRLEVIWRL